MLAVGFNMLVGHLVQNTCTAACLLIRGIQHACCCNSDLPNMLVGCELGKVAMELTTVTLVADVVQERLQHIPKLSYPNFFYTPSFISPAIYEVNCGVVVLTGFVT